MVSVILPTYNERDNIKDLICDILSQIKETIEIIVVDDNSPDHTWKIAEDIKNPNVKVIRRINERGLATAIARGIREAKGDVISWMDADKCMPPAVLAQMLKNIGEYDIVLGSRYIEDGKDARNFFRRLTSRIINGFSRLLLGAGVKDWDSGFIALKRAVLERVAFPARGYGDYFIEFIYRCRRKGFKIKEVPYTFTERQKGSSKTAPTFLEFLKLGFGYLSRIVSLRFSRI
jgi:dolichol-phosphate mannosyltransferase